MSIRPRNGLTKRDKSRYRYGSPNRRLILGELDSGIGSISQEAYIVTTRRMLYTARSSL